LNSDGLQATRRYTDVVLAQRVLHFSPAGEEVVDIAVGSAAFGIGGAYGTLFGQCPVPVSLPLHVIGRVAESSAFVGHGCFLANTSPPNGIDSA
jgi:hypothetical protein